MSYSSDVIKYILTVYICIYMYMGTHVYICEQFRENESDIHYFKDF